MYFISKLINRLFHLNNKKKNKHNLSKKKEVDYPNYYLIDDNERKEIIDRLKGIEFIHKNDLFKVIVDKMNSIDSFLQIQSRINYLFKKAVFSEEEINELISFVNQYDNDLKRRIMLKYQEINYFSITTTIIDDVIEKLKIINSDYYHHRYNKNYYNTSIILIKNRIMPLVNIYKKEINTYKKKVKYKYRDKYNLLDCRNIFKNIISVCECLLERVNQRVVDIKKKSDAKEIENIINDWQDMELAIDIINKDEQQLKSRKVKEILNCLDEIYNNYLNSSLTNFIDESKKEKTRLVILYNKLNFLYCEIKRKSYIRLEHINFNEDDIYKCIININDGIKGLLLDKYHFDINNIESYGLINNLINKKSMV